MGERDYSEILAWLLDTWTAKLADSVEGMTGERPGVSWKTTASPSPELLWWEQPYTLGRQLAVWAGAPEAAWLEIGGQILRGAGIEVSDPQDARNTYLEVLSQTCNGLAQAMSARLGREISCSGGKEAAPPADEVLAFEVEVTLGGAAMGPLQFACQTVFMDLLRTDAPPPQAVAMAASAAPAAPAPVQAAAASQSPGPAGSVPKTLELLMEVELPVSVSFGRAQLPLKDVLKLSTGSIVELNRATSEPVEVIVNNCVIARGEVVVVEGNYGVRISEIISREKRLRTLQ